MTTEKMGDLPVLTGRRLQSAQRHPWKLLVLGPPDKCVLPHGHVFSLPLPIWETADASINFVMRYLVKACVKCGREGALAKAIADRTLGLGSIAGDEYLYNMEMARVNAKGEAHWVETCFCDPPLEEERPYWEKYFDLLSVKDAHSRRNCLHENGSERWACCDCDCTKRVEEKLAQTGKSFLQELQSL